MHSTPHTPTRAIEQDDDASELLRSEESSEPHKRGVTRNRGGFPQMAVFRGHTCTGDLAFRHEVPEHAVTQAKIDAFHALLEDDCPSDPRLHGPMCPFFARQMRAVRARREALRDELALHPHLHLRRGLPLGG